jgi:hypothetical protein
MVIPYPAVEEDCMTQYGCARSNIHHVPYLPEACADILCHLIPLSDVYYVVLLHNREQPALHWKQQYLLEHDTIFVRDNATHHCHFAMRSFI